MAVEVDVVLEPDKMLVLSCTVCDESVMTDTPKDWNELEAHKCIFTKLHTHG